MSLLVDAYLLIFAALEDIPEHEPTREWLTRTLAATPRLTSRDVPDPYLAALAVENGLVLATHDRGFARFRMLRWRERR